jgi:hypothetical protein
LVGDVVGIEVVAGAERARRWRGLVGAECVEPPPHPARAMARQATRRKRAMAR